MAVKKFKKEGVRVEMETKKLKKVAIKMNRKRKMMFNRIAS